MSVSKLLNNVNDLEKIVKRPEHSSIVGGSNAARILSCPSSGWLDRKLDKPRTSSVHADVGSMLHACMEVWLNTVEYPVLGFTSNDQVLTEDQLEGKLRPAARAFCDLLPDEAGDEWIEQHVELREITGAFGKVDYAATNLEGDHLTVLDWKFGDGVIVSPEQNKQGMFYACGMLDFIGGWDVITKVTIAIIQPARGSDDVLRTWDCEIGDLVAFYAELVDAVIKSTEEGHYAEGDQCRFCPVAVECPLKQSTLHELRTTESETDKDGADIAPHELTDSRLGELITQVDSMQTWFKALQAEAASRIEAGSEVTGWKLVAKRVLRKWADAGEVEAWCRLKKIPMYRFMPRSLASPAQLEKTKKFPPELLANGGGGSTLAPISDRRNALTFENVTQTLQENSTDE